MNQSAWHVLIVEDEQDSVQMVSEILGFHGIDVEVARNGYECLETLNNFRPTLIIMDLSMPEMDGWQTLANIRDNPETADIPVVAITAYHSANVAHDAMNSGFDAYYSKPIDALSFVKNITTLVQ